ncbi:MAG: C39 family peptidase [Polyangiaceae bacterium]
MPSPPSPARSPAIDRPAYRTRYPRPLPALIAACLAAVTSLAACTTAPTSPPPPASPPAAESAAPVIAGAAPDLPTVLVQGVPHVLQKPDFCGEAATEMFLRSRGVPLDQDAVFALTGMDPARGMGATTRELAAGLTRIGLDVGPVWLEARPSAAAADLDTHFRALHADLAAGVPSIVCTHFDERPDTTEHFRLILGYDHATDEIVYSDPALKNGAYLRMSRARFLSLWPLKYRTDRWTVIRMRLAGTPRAGQPTSTGTFTPADYAQHVLSLRPMLRPEHTVVIEPPFVVVGDEAPDRVRERASGTVRWAVQHLKADFFAKDPERILTVWLFGSKATYDDAVARHFPGSPDTPYGFYSPAHRALVMNIGTGGGTLVHEIVHPFMEANVPDCPSWLNEGLGSLFEQSAERAGHIVGLTNWRLAGLQRAIRRRQVPTFSALLHTSRDAFYDEDRGTNYAQSRYLLYHLQEHGLLRRFWADYLKDRATDPSGFTTLARVVADKDMATFQKRWEAEVLTLTFP